MSRIILDTNFILRNPRILGLQDENTILTIPLDVKEELRSRMTKRGADFDRRIELLERAEQNGNLEVINTLQPIYRTSISQILGFDIDNTDAAIIAIALNFLHKGEEIVIATYDKAILGFAEERGIPILKEDQIDNLVGTNTRIRRELSGQKVNSLQQEIEKYEKTERKSNIRKILYGFGAGILANIVYNNKDQIISTINIWGTVGLTLLIGVMLFIFREKQRLSYGIFEVIVGVVAIIMLFQPTNFEYLKLTFDLDFNLKLLGGLYIMVRGQDNIVRSQKDTKFGLMLKENYGIGG